MEALVFFVFPLFIYLAIKVAILRDVDYTALDKAKYAEGIKMIEFGFVEDAVVYFDKAVKANPKSMVAWAMRGKAHFTMKNYYQAIYNYHKAQSLNHDLPEVFLNKGIAFYKIDDPEAALKEFNKAVWFYREKNPEAFRWRGLTHDLLGNKEAAEKDFQKVKLLTNDFSSDNQYQSLNL